MRRQYHFANGITDSWKDQARDRSPGWNPYLVCMKP